MEDEDGESKVGDMWSILEDQRIKDPTFEKTLKHSIDDVYADTIEDEKHIIRYNSHTAKESPSKVTNAGSKIVFKGFKKRILAQAQETQTVDSNHTAHEQGATYANASPKNKDKRTDAKRGKITEYAQYLGLQPSSKSKCSKCHSLGNSCSTLKQNQCTCNPAMAPVQGLSSTGESSNLPHTTNFKITRKVYLCAACGTYFENWNLFLHMRDIHKRHICLFCLGMFGQAERLSYHLSKKHSVPEMTFASVEDFYRIFKGSCYLVCCTCEKVFSETDNFYNHFCSPSLKPDASTSMCTLCRQTGTHANSCSLALEASKDSQYSLHTTVPQTTGLITSTYGNPAVTNKSTSKKSKSNRNRYMHDDFGGSYQQRLGALLRKTSGKSTETRLIENQVPTDVTTNDADNSHCMVEKNFVRDTVSETIMEVSRYVGDSCSDEGGEKEDKEIFKEGLSDTKPEIFQSEILKQENTSTVENPHCRETTYDDVAIKDAMIPNNVVPSVTEASSCNFNVNQELTNALRADISAIPRNDLNKPNSVQIGSTETRVEADNIEETPVRPTSGPEDASSSVQSPIARSLFSPQHESLASEIRPKETFQDDAEEQQNEIEPVMEPPSSVSFNAVPSSDRSLVIKICANRNSQFSVWSGVSETSQPTVRDTDHGEIEENNNAEESTSEEKLAIVSGKEKDHMSDRMSNEESDSDSDKLAVVDGNVDETKEGVEEEEEEEEDEEEEEEETGEININPDIRDPAKDVSTNINENEENKLVCENANGNDNTDLDRTENVTDVDAPINVDQTQSGDRIVLAGEDVPTVDLNVEGTLDSMEIEDLLKRCIETGSPMCVYCNHARHIAVNGKQLGLHMLAEHKFQPQHPAIIIHSDQFTARVKRSLDELESHCFNLDSYNSTNGTYNVPAVRTYECFHCRFHSSVHKELYLHNRKMHQKTILICIMCKSTFYSYSELLCHLCLGTYSPNINVKYRCCLCPVTNLPSAFRLMVHLRKRHHACDVCLESTGNQQRLSNHVWKHKLHHLCYRCNIAYRNKPDITKHLFWKHGTESVLCKKCLQKKWPHIYHFCIPPTAFVCEECGSSFSRAVALKVHKRLHSGDQPYACNECSERFISKKLLAKHEEIHKEPPVNVDDTINVSNTPECTKSSIDEEKLRQEGENTLTYDTGASSAKDTVKESVKKVVDVYDLPPLNLSSESDTDDEDEESKDKKTETKENIEDENESVEKTKTATNDVEGTTDVLTFDVPGQSTNQEETVSQEDQHPDNIVEVERNEEEKKQEAEIMDGIWDNFKTYTASLEPEESASNRQTIEETEAKRQLEFLRSVIQTEHDYWVTDPRKDERDPEDSEKVADETTENITDSTTKQGIDEYPKDQRSPSTGSVALNVSCENDSAKKKVKTPKKKRQNGSTSSSDSSSDSDSSSCSCGTNCSCSSSSSGSSSSSSSSSDSDSSASENTPRKANRKERKRDRESASERKSPPVDLEKREPTPQPVENGPILETPGDEPVRTPPLRTLLRESDLETDETETDEDFYDEHPQQLANKLLTEKRNQLMLLASVAPTSNVDSSFTIPLNNGVADTNDSSFPTTPCPEPISEFAGENVIETQQTQTQKRKVKTKKRKKGERGRQRNQQQRTATPINTVESIKLNIPKAFYQKTPGYTTVHSNRSLTNEISTIALTIPRTEIVESSTNAGAPTDTPSETVNKRSSKRKRIPKRFYGDSSDEETEKHHQPALKWRKVETPALLQFQTQPPPPPPPLPIVETATTRPSFGGKGVATYASRENSQLSVASATESDEMAESSSGGEGEGDDAPAPVAEAAESSDSELELDATRTNLEVPQQIPRLPDGTTNPTAPERAANLYCYCQCPYDEVSEMIACDGDDCRIEWFHFECVGIMVPPKGKWYCPDCRKKHGIVQNTEDYFD